MFKKQNKIQKYGKIPPKTPEYKPWHTLCINLISPYEIGQGKNKTQLYCLTMIDPATGWFEIAEIPNKKADFIANILEINWLTRYPWPTEIVMDRGREFQAEVSDAIYNEYGIRKRQLQLAIHKLTQW